MKPVKRSRTFEKHFKQRITPNHKLVSQFEKRLSLFLAGQRGYPLNDHHLSGSKEGLRSFSIAGDCRVIYQETTQTIRLLDIGSHNQVYRD